MFPMVSRLLVGRRLHSLAQANGTVVSWGYNEATVPNQLKAVAISAGALIVWLLKGRRVQLGAQWIRAM